MIAFEKGDWLTILQIIRKSSTQKIGKGQKKNAFFLIWNNFQSPSNYLRYQIKMDTVVSKIFNDNFVSMQLEFTHHQISAKVLQDVQHEIGLISPIVANPFSIFLDHKGHYLSSCYWSDFKMLGDEAKAVVGK